MFFRVPLLTGLWGSGTGVDRVPLKGLIGLPFQKGYGAPAKGVDRVPLKEFGVSIWSI